MSRPGSEAARKAVHVGMGGLALLLRWLTPLQAALCAALAVLFNRFLLHPVTRGKLLRGGERARSFSSGIGLYPAAVLALILVFHARLDLAAAVWGLLAFGDGMATVIGLAFPGRRLPWNPAKSWHGSLAFLVFGASASLLLLTWVRGDGAPPLPLVVGCLAATLGAAFVESFPTGIDDNIGVPLSGAAILYTASIVDPALLARSGSAIGADALRGLGVNIVLAVAAYAARSVSASGACWGSVLGTLLYAFAGWRGFLLLFVFFLLGSAATRVGWRRKAALGIAQEKGGRRSAKHAFANTLAGVLFAFLSQATPAPRLFLLALAAAFATAAADTVSSEIGQAYGRRTFLITSGRRVPPGTDGAVSLEGTLAGVLAALVVASVAWQVGLVSGAGVAIVILGAVIGTTLESCAGALFAGSRTLDNELVNFANTLAGGLSAIVLQRFLPG